MGHNNKLFEECFTHNGVLIFNKPDNEIKNTGPITKFKKILSNFLIGKSFSTLWKNLTMDPQLMDHE